LLKTTFTESEAGQTMAEYAFILGLVAIVSVSAFAAFGQSVGNLLTPVVHALTP
jgi:Flp pilus assembly pilin Flp